MEPDSEQARQARAASRRQRAVLRRTNLHAADPDLHPIAGADAISLVAALTRHSWSLAALPVPRYERAAIPCRFVPGRPT